MTALHDAARQAALNARDRVCPHVSDYAALTIAEAAMSVQSGRPAPPIAQPETVDVEALELPYDQPPARPATPVRNPRRWL